MFPVTDKSKTKLLLAVAVISIAINAILLVPVFWTWALATPNAAAWVEAIGAILAIGVAVYAVSYQVLLARRDRSADSKSAFVADLARAASVIEQAQMYSLKIAMSTLGHGTLAEKTLALIQIEAEVVHRQMMSISPLLFANTPILDALTTSQSGAHLLSENAKGYATEARQPVAVPVPPTLLHSAALDLSEKFRSSAVTIRQYARQVETGQL